MAARALALLAGRASPPELFEYDDLARSLLAGQGYAHQHLGIEYRSYYSGVAYVWLTAALYASFPPGETAMRAAQALLSAAGAATVFVVGRAVAGVGPGLLAALLTAVHPALVYYDTRKLHPLGFDVLLTAAVAATLLRARRSHGLAAPVLAGAVLGLGVLQRGSLLPMLALGPIWLVWWRGNPRRVALAYAAGAVLVLAPWLVRSTLHHGLPRLVTTTGEHFWIGNAPASRGSALLPSGECVLDQAPATLWEDLRARDEAGQDAVFWRSAWDSVSRRPSAFAAGVARKFAYFWTLAPQTGVLYPPPYRRLYLAFYLPLLVLAVFGAARLWCAPVEGDERAGLVLILLVLTTVSAVHAVFYVELRHRWAVEPLLLVLSASGAAGLWSGQGAARPSRGAAPRPDPEA